MKNTCTIFALFGTLMASPAFGQTPTLLAATNIRVDETGTPTGGDSTTFAYNSEHLRNLIKRWTIDPTGTWTLKSRLTGHTYDANGNLLYYLAQLGDDVNGWTNTNQYTYTFETDGRELTYLHEKWANNTWVEQTWRVREYDQEGKLLSSTGKSSRYLYTYDSLNRLQMETYQTINGSWIDISRIVYAYLPNHTTVETTEYSISSVWVPLQRNTFNYDASGNLLQHLNESGDGTFWANGTLKTNSYDANGYILQSLNQSWDGTEWVNSSLTAYGYDTQYNLTYWLWSTWTNSSWEGSYRQFNLYNDKNLFIYARQEIWDGANWRLYSYGNNYYDEFVSTHTLSQANFVVFPNPASTSITLKGEGFLHAHIIDLQGRPVRSQSLHGQGDETIQLGNLPSGNYILQVVGANGKGAVKPLQIMR